MTENIPSPPAASVRGWYLLYRLLLWIGAPLVTLYFLVRGLRNRAYLRTLPQRVGVLPRSLWQTVDGAIWLHAVSVGEVISAAELIRRLRTELPAVPVFVSTSTLAGRATASAKLAGLAAGVFYAPLDYVFAVRRVLRAIRPSVVVVMETEIWPHLFREARRVGCGLLIVNGRISDRAAPRYRRLRSFFAAALSHADAVLTQDEALKRLYIEIGAPAERTRVGGNLKYDFVLPDAPAESPVRALTARLRPQPVWIAASTMPPRDPGDPDEDDAVIAAFRELAPRHPRLLLLLAPRKPERFDEAARKLDAAGIPYVRRSRMDADPPLPGVLLLDTIGELASLFALGDVVFLGGSLCARGGHNVLEPALAARPVIVGPHMENFRAMAAEFQAAGALVEIATAGELAPAVERLLRDPARAGELARRGLACAQARRGATATAAAAIADLHRTRLPVFPRTLPARLILTPLSGLWRWGAARRLARMRARSGRLRARVVSVGNITAGGTGKTPFVLLAVARLQALGARPGIVTRGYGRTSPEKILVAQPAAVLPRRQTGDEPQIFLRSGLAPVGIGADRYHAGRQLEEMHQCDVVVLDDGFQHVRLHRDLDIVLIDALNPFGGGHTLPLGRLREPLSALARASAFVITRCEAGRMLPAIEAALRRYNPEAPILHARTRPVAWVRHGDGARFPVDAPPFSKPGAFCGLGNPESFWSTLRAAGVAPVSRCAFADHHVYRPHEVQRLAHQFRLAAADAAVTTEKDHVNFDQDCGRLLGDLPLYWLEIRLEAAEPESLDALLGNIPNRGNVS